MKWLKFILFLSFTSVIFSCRTMGVMHLNPVEQESIWDSGKQIVKQEKEGVKVVVSYN